MLRHHLRSPSSTGVGNDSRRVFCFRWMEAVSRTPMSLFSLRDVVARATPLTELDDTEAALAVYRTFFEVARTRDPALFDRLSETLNQQRAQCSAIRRSGHIAAALTR